MSEVEIIGGKIDPTLQDLNKKAIQKLYELMDGLDAKSAPDMVRACVESLSKLNSSVKGSDIMQPNETNEERRAREAAEILEAEING